MCIRKETPCDFGECPYNAMYNNDCEYWCGVEEPEDNYDFEDDDDEVGFYLYLDTFEDDD